eukprot:TRINITY_DN5810_c0_g1_i1.p1 TRINITY_DN5810_c0_g1~~TRINITY_DN5810_c0_g1_i1.p1  ORF type:complete len:2523 (+),score=604.44 TRINITY_DN5810_c0_g1_i1:37-7605(+)
MPMESPHGISQSTDRSLGGVSPDWYCSGGDREDELRKENRNLQQKLDTYEDALKRKNDELENVTKALHDERKFEEETLSTITQGSEKMLEQKGLQVQQLNNTVQKLHNALRKKDEHLSGLVSSNLKADGIHAELVAEANELKVRLRHAQTELSREQTRHHRIDGQCSALSEQNQRLEDLILHYRSELTRRDALLNSQHMDQCNSARQRSLSDLEATELLSDIISLVQKLDSELLSLISDTSNFSYRVLPKCPRPGQRTKLIVTSLSAHSIFAVQSTTNVVNITDFSPLSETSNSCYVTECCFTPESEGLVSICVSESHKLHENTSNMDITVTVEGAPCVCDVTGSTLSIISETELNKTVLITLRNGIGELVPESGSIVFGDSQGVVKGKKRVLPSIATPRGMEITDKKIICESSCVATFNVTNAATREVSLDDGCCVVCSLVLGDVECRSPQEIISTIDPSSCVIKTSSNITVGDRSCVVVTLYSGGDSDRISPLQLHQLIQDTGFLALTADCNTAVDLDLLSDADSESIFFYFTPLQSGPLSLQLAIGRVTHSVVTTVSDPGQDPCSLFFTDKFGTRNTDNDTSSYKIGSDSELNLRLGFYDSDGVAAAATPPLDDVTGVVRDRNGNIITDANLEISAHPDSPAACLVSIVFGKDTNLDSYQIVCSALGESATHTVSVTGSGSEKHTNENNLIEDLLPGVLCEYTCSPNRVTPGGVYTARLTPLTHSLEPVLLSRPTELRVEIISCKGDVPLLGTSNKYKMTLRHPSTIHNYFELSASAPVALGDYRLKISSDQGSNLISSTLSVISDCVLATREAQQGLKGTLSLIPNIVHLCEQQEERKTTASDELKSITRELEALRRKNDEQQKSHAIEIAAAQEAALRESEANHQKMSELKKKLSDERNAHKDYQSRWASREDVFTDEREQLAKDKLMWLDKIKSLTSQEEQSLKIITQLRDERQDLQAAHSNEVRLVTQKFKTKLAELTQQQENSAQRWVTEKSSMESMIIDLQGQCRNSENALMRLTDANTRLEKSLQQSGEGVAALSDDLALQKAATTQLQSQLSASAEQHSSALDSLKQSCEQQNIAHQQALQQANKNHATEVSALQDKVKRVSKEYDLVIADLREELQSKSTDSARELEEAISTRNAQINELTTTVDNLNNKLKETITAHESDMDHSTAQIKRERDALAQSQSKISNLQQQVADLTSTIESLTDSKEELTNAMEQERDGFKAEFFKMETEMETIRTQMSVAEESVLEVRTRAENETMELTAAYKSQLESLQKQLTDVSKQRDNDKIEATKQLDDERRTWQQEKMTFKVSLNQLELSKEDLERDLSLAKSSAASELQEAEQHWATEAENLKREIQTLTEGMSNTNENHNSEIESLKKALQDVNKAKSEKELALSNQITALTEEHAASEAAHNRALKLAKEEHSVIEARSRQSLQNAEHEIQDAKQQNEHLSQRLSDIEETTNRERERWSSEKQQFKERLTSLQKTSSELASEHKAQLEECDAILLRVKSEAEANLNTKVKQIESNHQSEIAELMAQMDAKAESSTAEWDERLSTLCAAHKSELARLHEAAAEREAAAESCLEAARANYKKELNKMETEVARAKADRVAARQRFDQDRSNDKHQLKVKYTQEIETLQLKLHESELKHDRLSQQHETLKTQHAAELSEAGRQLQKLQQEEAESQQKETMDEIAQLRKAWQENLNSATAAHDCDRESFAKEREAWRVERLSLWKERDSTRASLETALADAAIARQESDQLSSQRSTEVAKLVDENATLARQLVELRETSTTAESQTHHSLQLELAKLQSDNELLQQDLDAARNNPDSNAQIASLTSQIQSLREKHTSTVSSLTNQISSTEDELNHARSLSQQLQREVTSANLRFEKLSERITDQENNPSSILQSEYDSIREKYSQVTAESASRREKISALEATNRKLESDNTSLANKFDQHMKECNAADLQKQLTELQKEYDTHLESCRGASSIPDSNLLQKYNELQELHAQLKAEMKVLRDAFEDENAMEQQFLTQKGNIPELEMKIQNMEASHDEQLASYRKLLDETQLKYQRAIEQQATERNDWSAERSKLRKDASDLRRQMDHFEDSNQSQVIDKIRQLELSHQEECSHLKDQLEKTKTCWKQEKTEFDAFLLEIDKEKEDLTKRAELSDHLHQQLENVTSELRQLKQQHARDSFTGNGSVPPSPISPPAPVSQSDLFSADISGDIRSVSPTAGELIARLTAEYGSPEEALHAMKKGGEVDVAGIRYALRRIGMEEHAQVLIGTARTEGVRVLLGSQSRSPPREYTDKMREYHQAEMIDKQMAKQSQKLQNRSQERSRSITTIAPKQLSNRSQSRDPSQKMSRSSKQSSAETQPPSGKSISKAFPYFGIEVTDGVRMGSSKQEYCGIKVVRVKGAALQAGIQAGDVIKEIAGSEVASLAQFKNVMKKLPSHEALYVLLDRCGTEIIMTVRPEATNALPGSLSKYTQAVTVPAPGHREVDIRSVSANSSEISGLGGRHRGPFR